MAGTVQEIVLAEDIVIAGEGMLAGEMVGVEQSMVAGMHYPEGPVVVDLTVSAVVQAIVVAMVALAAGQAIEVVDKVVEATQMALEALKDLEDTADTVVVAHRVVALNQVAAGSAVGLVLG